MFELLIFDLDGTLVDSRRDIATSVNLTLGELGIPKREPELIYGYIGGGVHNLMRNSLTEEHAGLLDKSVDIFWAFYKEHVLDTTNTFPGIMKMIELLSDSKRMAIATNKPYAHTHILLHGLDLARYFVSIQGWKMGLAVKPDPAIVLMALDEAGTPKDRAVMIGDGTNDVLAARAAGIKSCAVGYGYGVKEKIMAAAPDYYAESVEDIVKLFK